MSWCPNCKQEYQDGITNCADCGCGLVSELEYEPVFLAEFNNTGKDKFIDFLNFSEVKGASPEYCKETETWKIYIAKSQEKEAKKLLDVFISQNLAEETEKNESFYEEAAVQETAKKDMNKGSYKRKTEKYEDFKSSASIFLPFGGAGLLFVILNIFGIFHIITNPFQFIVFSLCFGAFTYIGFTSLLKLKSIKVEIEKEKSETETIITWLKENINEDILSSATDPEKPEEFNYITRTEKMKELLLIQYPDLEDNFIDLLLEDFYNEYMENQKPVS